MPYIGNTIRAADDYRLIDDISSGFNGSETSFALQVAGSAPVPFPKSPQQVLISVNGVIQEPDPTGTSGFNLVGTNIVFSSAPTNGHAFFGIIYATADYLNAGGNFPAGSLGAPSITFIGDENTGLFRKSGGSVGFVSDATEIANFDSNGITISSGNIIIPDSIIHNGDTNTKIRFPAADTITAETGGSERVRVDSSGNVGIGTASIDRLFHVQGTNNVLGKFENDQSICMIEFQDTDTTAGNRPSIGSDGNNAIVFAGGSERVRIDSSGKVGIGIASSIDRPLHIVNNSGAIVKMEANYSGSVTGIEGVLTASGANRYVVGMYGKVVNTSNTESDVARIRFYNEQASPTTSDSPGYITFETTPDGSATPTEKVRLTSSGNLGIGTTSPNAALEVINSSTGRSYSTSGATELVVERNGNSQIAIIAANDSDSIIHFGDTDDENRGLIGYDHANDSMRFRTADTVQATLDSSGNLGIGTTSPAALVHIMDGDLLITDNSTATNSGQAIYFQSTTNGWSTGSAHCVIHGLRGDNSSGIIRFDTRRDSATNERMRLDANGVLLIGTTSSRDLGGLSRQKLTVEDTSGTASIGIINNQNSTGFASLRFAKSRGTSVGSNTVVQSGDPLGGIVFCGADGTDMASVGAQILAEVDGTPGSNDMPGRLEFFTTADGAASPTERMRIDKGGRIMFNMTSPLDTIAGSLNLSGGGSGGRIAFQGTSSSAGAGIAEIFAHWGTNKVAGMIALSGADTTNKDDGQLLFYTSSAGPAVTERMRIDSAGNVGIGTSSPITKLEIQNGSDLDNILVVRGADASTEYAGVGVTGGNAIFTAGGVGSTSAGMVFRTASGGVETERARIDSAGRLVVGSNSAFTNLGFSSSAAIQAIGAYNVGSIASVNNEANGNTCAVTSAKIRGTNAVNNGDVVGSHAFDGYDGGTFRTIARIDGVVSSAVSSNSISGELRFRTRDGSTQAERMRIDKDGHVYIGTTAKDPGLTNTFGSFIDPQGYIAISGNGATAAYFNRSSTTGVIVSYRYNGTQRGALETDGTVIALTGTSDYRLKENQVTISDGITRLKQLKPYRFNFKETPSKTIDGFFAHEVNSVVPEAVFGEKDAVATEADTQSGYTLGEIKPQRVDQSKLVPLLTAALQEEISKREALEARVAALEAA